MRTASVPARWLLPLLFSGGLLALAPAAALRAAAPPPSFESQVRPLLMARCAHCHGEEKQGGLDLRTVPAMLRGGNGGAAVVPGSASRSRLYRRVAEGTMPPASAPRLRDTEVRLLKAWIDGGAPGGAAAAEPSRHWAWQPVKRPAVPVVKDRAWVKTPIDAFVLAELEKRGLRPSPPADRRTLIRRASLDLTGLPPTPEEVDAFLADRSPDAWEKVVDRLLASPAYGERWGRHWLDVARYADTNGYERDGDKPHAWRYRDYVIRSLNADKPFDRFLTEQLAGDELPGADAETQIATTFLRLGTWDDEPAEPMVDRSDQLDDVLGTTATAFMGVTLRCARCHDHKFEPFSQQDYYRLLAVFQPLKRPQVGREDLDVLAGTEAELAAYRAATERADAEVAALRARLDALQAPVWERLPADRRSALPADAQAAFAVPVAGRNDAQKELVKRFQEKRDALLRDAAAPQERGALAEVEARIAAVNAARPPEPPRAYIWTEEGPKAPPTHLLKRGDPAHPADEVQPGFPAVLLRGPVDAPRPLARTTGRRLWLARWLTRPDHPLTARVLINRVWQGHFGEGLVRSENDFGLMGQRPTHPALLDWLASVFTAPAESSPSPQHRPGTPRAPSPEPPAPNLAWSLKRLHRLVLLSSVYRQSSTPAAGPASAGRGPLAVDPEERLLWRWRPRRLEAESVRDSVLLASGQLNRKQYGPGVYPVIPRAVLEGQSRPGSGWGKSDEAEASRRSIYIFSKRSLAVPELEVLDAPDNAASCEQRAVSTIAPQALTFLNGEFIRAQSRHLAARLAREAGEDPAARVRRAFLLTVARPATAAETQAGIAFLAEQERQIAKDLPSTDPALCRRRALEAFALVMLNTNEFYYID